MTVLVNGGVRSGTSTHAEALVENSVVLNGSDGMAGMLGAGKPAGERALPGPGRPGHRDPRRPVRERV